MIREVNAAATAIADQAEGCVLHVYRDPRGILTAGWGHTGSDLPPLGTSVTQSQANAWRTVDMASAAAAVERLVNVPLTDNQFSALAEFTFNVGVGNFAGSTLLRQLNRRNYHAVPSELMRWTKSGGRIFPGLVARRTKEVALWGESEHVTAQNTFPTPSPHIAVSIESAIVPKPSPPSLIEAARAWLNRKAA